MMMLMVRRLPAEEGLKIDTRGGLLRARVCVYVCNCVCIYTYIMHYVREVFVYCVETLMISGAILNYAIHTRS